MRGTSSLGATLREVCEGLGAKHGSEANPEAHRPDDEGGRARPKQQKTAFSDSLLYIKMVLCVIVQQLFVFESYCVGSFGWI